MSTRLWAIFRHSLPARAPAVVLLLSLAPAATASAEPIVDPPVVPVREALLDRYGGMYAYRGQPRFAVRHLGNQLLVQPSGDPHNLKPLPASDEVFFLPGTLARFTFLRDPKSALVTGMEWRREDGTVEVCERTDQLLPEQRPTVPVAPAVLERYVGAYERRPGVTVTVTLVEGAHLFIQPAGEWRAEAFASSPTEFFLKLTDARITFQADGDGPAPRMIVHTAGRNLFHRRVR